MEMLSTASVTTPDALIAVSPSLRQPKRILLVDDDALILRLFTEILSLAGYAVVSCGGGVAAIEQFRAHSRFDLLMTDFQMPIMNGVQLAKLLTGVSRRLPVLIVSGSAVEEIPLWELWRKKWCFLAKPTSAHLLLKTVDQLCGLVPIHMAEMNTTPAPPFLLRSGHALKRNAPAPVSRIDEQTKRAK